MTKTDETKKQQTLPADGMARKTIPALEKPTQEYLKARNKRQAATRVEVQTKTNLLTAMREHVKQLPKDAKDRPFYAFEDDEGELQVAYLDEKFNVKVKKAAAAGDEDEE